MSEKNAAERFLVIDLLRSIAIYAMVTYHFVFDLAVFYRFPIDPLSGGWWLLARTTAILFLLLVGISFVISINRMEQSGATSRAIHRKYFFRGLLIFSCGLLVTLATYFFDPSTYVRFGILHMIGVSTMLLPFFRPLKEGNTLLGLIIIFVGNLLRWRIVPTSLLLPLGLVPPSFVSVDYFPLLPWIGVILIGMAIAHALYIRKTLPISVLGSKSRTIRTLSLPGRHSLLIYLLHQPILLFILTAILGAPR